MHPTLTPDKIETAAGIGIPAGFCVRCGADAEGIEPTARRMECDACGERCVYGAEALLLASVG